MTLPDTHCLTGSLNPPDTLRLETYNSVTQALRLASTMTASGPYSSAIVILAHVHLLRNAPLCVCVCVCQCVSVCVCVCVCVGVCVFLCVFFFVCVLIASDAHRRGGGCGVHNMLLTLLRGT